MKHLIKSFQEHVGSRGVHFYDNEHCNFLTWVEVFKFIDVLTEKKGVEDIFSERLADTLANYDPNKEFVAVQQNDNTVSVELYSHPL